MITRKDIRVLRGNNPQKREHAVFDLTAGAIAGTFVQLDYSTVTAANDGMALAKWKLADGAVGAVFQLDRAILASSITELPLEEEIRQETTIEAPQLNGAISGAPQATATQHEVIEVEGGVNEYNFFKGDTGTGQITASTPLGSRLTCAAGKLVLASAATQVVVGILEGFTDATTGVSGAFRAIVRLTGNTTADLIV